MEAAGLSAAVRILSIADMFEALASRRPYRQDLTEEQVMDILVKNVGPGLDPACFEALKVFLSQSKWAPVDLAA